ncbi:DNA-binding domain-containing protein Ecym_8423 [Eremothecium cymbalariae DBVPG|uniref:HTH CENPB-type domain-containing protein n=1 Tax=Eremothecium cymbalariae (strain CBS 270.75 / DBVPG 7215 / KCTC 17166 / NRRL Y-17582) TaxID=931890 RepID=G8JXW8_ERECY|nr:Hypothetical protein Ecym_8423 [Eremothecium cymbalariae DBVPG\
MTAVTETLTQGQVFMLEPTYDMQHRDNSSMAGTVEDVGGVSDSLSSQGSGTMPRPPRATLEQRIQILDLYHSTKITQAQIVNQFKEQVSISGSTLSEWIKKEDELRERYKDLQEKQLAKAKVSKNKSNYKYDEMNKLMDDYVSILRLNNQQITENTLRECWQQYARYLGITDPKRLKSFSNGWLSQFKKRHGLKLKRNFLKPGVVSSGKNTNYGKVAPLVNISKDLEMDDLFCQVSPVVGNSQSYSPPTYESIQKSESSTEMKGQVQHLKAEDSPVDLSASKKLEYQYQGPPSVNNIPTSSHTTQSEILTSKPGDLLMGSTEKGCGTGAQYLMQPQNVAKSQEITQFRYIAQVPQEEIHVESSSPVQNLQRSYMLSEMEFERFLNKYAHEFLVTNMDRYPQSFALFQHLTQTFREERDLNADDRLKNLFMKC